MFFALLAIGFGFTLRGAKFFNVSYGGAFLVGGYVMFWLYRMLNIPLTLSILLSIIVSGLYLLLAYQFIFRTLLERKAKDLVILISAFGLLTATSAILGMIFGSQTTIVARHLSDIVSINIFGGTLNVVQATTVVFVFIIICALAYMRYKTRFGRAVRAIEDDGEVAELVGIPKNKTLLKVFFISGAIAGLAGIAEGLNVGIIPTSGLLYMLPTIVVAVIGGMQSFWGGIIAAFVLAVADQFTVMAFGGTWVQAVPFVILILMLLLRPEGILKR